MVLQAVVGDCLKKYRLGYTATGYAESSNGILNREIVLRKKAIPDCDGKEVVSAGRKRNSDTVERSDQFAWFR